MALIFVVKCVRTRRLVIEAAVQQVLYIYVLIIYYICVLLPLILYYICVLILPENQSPCHRSSSAAGTTAIYVSSYYYICAICVRTLLYRYYMCPHTTIFTQYSVSLPSAAQQVLYVSSYYYPVTCVLIRLYM